MNANEYNTNEGNTMNANTAMIDINNAIDSMFDNAPLIIIDVADSFPVGNADDNADALTLCDMLVSTM